MMSTLHQIAEASRPGGEKPPCCIGAPRGHCTVHCPRIEDVLYSQRKGKTNKGAQRWRCKACGTKWTSKGIIQPPVVPDTIVNSIGFGNGPEEMSMDMRGVTRPYKKTKTDSIIPTSPFPSMYGNSNTSPNQSPIPSPPSPLSSFFSSRNGQLGISNNYVPILPTSTPSPSNSNGSKSLITTKPVLVGVTSPSNGNNLPSKVPVSSNSFNQNQNQQPPQQQPYLQQQQPPQHHQQHHHQQQLQQNIINPINRPSLSSRLIQPKPSSPGQQAPLSPNSTRLYQSSSQQPPIMPPSKSSSNGLYTRSSFNSSSSNNVTRSISPSKVLLFNNRSPSPIDQNNSNNNNNYVSLRHQDIVNPYSNSNNINNENQQHIYTPSSNIVECLKKLLHSVSVFSNEYNVEHRLKLSNLLDLVSMPSMESQFSSSICNSMLGSIDSHIFNIFKHYQSLYQSISRHHSMMEDNFVPLTDVYFDDNEINRFLLFSEHHKYIEDNFELVLQELQNFKESLHSKKENIEMEIIDPSSVLTFSTSSNSGNLEQTKLETSKLLDSLAPLESTLNSMESNLKQVQKEINIAHKVFSFVELIYSVHINYHMAIIEKHQKLMVNYMLDVIQQNLFNCDVLSSAYNKLKISLASGNFSQMSGNSLSSSKRSRDDEMNLIDTSNPFIHKLNDLLTKYETIKTTSQQNQAPKERKVLAIYHSLCLDHSVPDDHPESPKRLGAVIRAIAEFSRQSDRIVIKNDPEEISDKWITTVHSPEYLRQLEELTDKMDSTEIRPLNVNNDGASTGINQFNSNSSRDSDCEDGDTFISKLSLKAARRAAGATITAIDQVMKGLVTSAFVAARPPGHHAGRDGLTSGTTSQGFCLLNHVCIGAKYAQLKYNVEKIAIVDFDVHHGNGSEEILANDNGFYFLSIHMFEEGFYPGSGGSGSMGVVNHNDYSENGGESGGNIVNIPLDPKSSANSFLKAFSIIIDKLNEYQPELLMISCGFDAHIDDHLASLCLSEDDYVGITRQLRRVADRWCKGRLVSILEGGYNINALKQCTIAHLSALTQDD
ncbi:hypothetical protein CYY_006107 [Polysphondylium violaceum]|uniref:histone deacetylase n=1 Tax=Polysphondylium violaceum TaxID=133409 RepID=A0A8J4V691_9MYCE|nr:hypothetical protein CYY_006107 [Polysphondylium violaceum]